MIDLHLHTTMSDGLDSPENLVSKAVAAGLTVIAVTDHDTVDGVAAAERAAAQKGIRCVPGIEITAMLDGHDVHILGHFLEHQSRPLVDFVSAQRRDRVRRARLIGERLSAIGVPIDIEQVIAAAGDRPVCRPALARALVDAGYASSPREAFDRYIGESKPAYVPRIAVTLDRAIGTIVDAGGIASLAHPGRRGLEPIIPGLVDAGLGAIEVYHPDHVDVDCARYLDLARSLDLGVTGGSDYHGDDNLHAGCMGAVTLPEETFEDLCRRWSRARTA